MGIAWTFGFILLGITALLLIWDVSYWWFVGFIAIILSQVLVISAWQDARFATFINALIFLAVIVGYGQWSFENSFRNDALQSLQRNNQVTTKILNENDIAHLPDPVQKYLRYAGVLGKAKVRNVEMIFNGAMRSKGKKWFPFTSQQYNFFDEPERLFFMKAKVNGLPTNGYHCYKSGEARMLIKLLSLFPIVNETGEKMLTAETVTVFNDMCLLAPAALIDNRIKWEAVNEFCSKASFTNKGVTINATLYFNEKDQLINFISDDRFESTSMKQIRFSTPISDYKRINGFMLPTYGEAIWHYPEGKFVYGKFRIKDVKYNVSN